MDKEKKKLLDIVDHFQGKKIAVWGDFILDEYLFGTTRRISREAPVLILSHQKKELSLGGAGNSVLNLEALGAMPYPVGVIGTDEPGRKILRILRGRKIPSEFLLKVKKFETPIKTRILAGEENTRKQQILRIDSEGKVPEEGDLKHRILAVLLEAKKFCSALLISDYNYLTVKEDIFRESLPRFKKARIPVTLDSRFRLLRFKGVTIATPNEPEVEEALKVHLGHDTEPLKKAGRHILKKLASPALLITRGSKGMALFEKRKPLSLFPVHGPTDIVDVTGAGDTVISVLTLALASGASFRQAVSLANYAGGFVVMKKGTATLTPQELKRAIISDSGN